jgi:hypothetical protein
MQPVLRVSSVVTVERPHGTIVMPLQTCWISAAARPLTRSRHGAVIAVLSDGGGTGARCHENLQFSSNPRASSVETKATAIH